MRSLIIALFASLLLITSASAQSTPPVTAQLSERLLIDTRNIQPGTELSGMVRLQFPIPPSGQWDISIIVDGLEFPFAGLEIKRIEFHCANNVEQEHNFGALTWLAVKGGSNLFVKRDFGFLREKLTFIVGRGTSCLTDWTPQGVYDVLAAGEIYVDFHTAETALAGEVGARLCLSGDRRDFCLP